jgi:hypothetical protein
MSVIALWSAGVITDMSHPTLGRMNLEMSIGFEVFAIAAFVWASIDYNRFIKFWMLRPAPYTRRVTVIFRLFFLACVIGGVWQLADSVTSSRQSVISYLSTLGMAGAWFVAFVLMLHLVEWMNRRKETKPTVR